MRFKRQIILLVAICLSSCTQLKFHSAAHKLKRARTYKYTLLKYATRLQDGLSELDRDFVEFQIKRKKRLETLDKVNGTKLQKLTLDLDLSETSKIRLDMAISIIEILIANCEEQTRHLLDRKKTTQGRAGSEAELIEDGGINVKLQALYKLKARCIKMLADLKASSEDELNNIRTVRRQLLKNFAIQNINSDEHLKGFIESARKIIDKIEKLSGQLDVGS